MKIKKTNLFVIGALSVAILAGCGGSVATQPTPQFEHGLYVADYGAQVTKYFSDMTGANEGVRDFSPDKPLCQAFDKLGRLYIGTWGGKVMMIPSPNAVNFETMPISGGYYIKIAFDSDNKIYVADLSGRKVIRADDVTGKNMIEMDLTPFTIDATDGPVSIALDSSNRIYVVARSAGRILRFNSMTDSSPVSYGSVGSTVGKFKEPSDVHIGSDGKIYIVDQDNDRIVRLNDMSGAGWISFGVIGNGVNQFFRPSSVTTDNSGKIFVMDAGNSRLCQLDDMVGTGWVMFGSHGTGTGQFMIPQNILVH